MIELFHNCSHVNLKLELGLERGNAGEDMNTACEEFSVPLCELEGFILFAEM